MNELFETELNTHHEVIDFGKHKGQLWTRVPISYLQWLGNSTQGTLNVMMARSEIKRRGTSYPTIDISGHAIDRASLSCRKIWHETALNNEEGLNSWLIRISQEALDKGEKKDDKILYKGMKFVFEKGDFYPTLKTIMRK